MFFDALIDGDDLSVPGWVLSPSIRAFRHDLACLAVNQERAEGSVRVLSGDFDRTSHVSFVHRSP
jgi:hypothetical protein